MTAFVDTNVIVRHLTADPPDMAQRATEFLRTATDLMLPDLITAEIVYVLESFYEVERSRVVELLRAVIAFPAIHTLDTPLLLRALEIYEVQRIDFADAYLAASAEVNGIGRVVSFDRDLDRLTTITRVEP